MSKHCRRTGFNGSCRVADPNMHGFLGSWGPMAPPARSFSSTIRKDLYALMASPSRAPRHSVRSMHAKHQVATIGRCPMESMCIDDLATTSVLVRRACWAREISWRNGWRRFPQELYASTSSPSRASCQSECSTHARHQAVTAGRRPKKSMRIDDLAVWSVSVRRVFQARGTSRRHDWRWCPESVCIDDFATTSVP